jgi:hypothetical protein
MILGNKAKSHSPHIIDIYKESINDLTDNSQDNRTDNFRLHNIAGSILHDPRICKCGKKPTSSKVKVLKHLDTGKAHYSGLQTCGSVWSCPNCKHLASLCSSVKNADSKRKLFLAYFPPRLHTL